MKKYNVPATEVVAFVGGAIMQAGSPTTSNPSPDPTQNIPGGNE